MYFEEFQMFHKLYPAHRCLSENEALKAWEAVALSFEEVEEVISWLRERQANDVSWHRSAAGVYVPRFDRFLRERWWRTPKANRRPQFYT